MTELNRAKALIAGSSNYRALVHSALASREPERLRAAFILAYEECALATTAATIPEIQQKLLNFSGEVAAMWKKLESGCTAAGGIDAQQRRALVDALGQSRPEWYAFRESLPPDQASLEAISRLRDSALALAWMSKAAKANSRLVFGTEATLSQLPPKLSLVLMEIEYCSLRECYSVAGHVYSCATTGACKESYVVDSLLASLPNEMQDETNPLRTAARARTRALFPQSTQVKPSRG